MTNSINFSSSDAYLDAALSGLAARQRAIANNVANVDTPNFKASEVDFEATLRNAIQRGSTSSSASPPDQAALNTAVSRSTLEGGTSARDDGNNVDIEREMEMLGETNLTYSALTQVMSNRLGILRTVINGR
jgi:flagellar basal-body rod protein FlgB